jgi:hypothetical protein
MLCEERVLVQLGKHPFRSHIHLHLLLPPSFHSDNIYINYNLDG